MLSSIFLPTPRFIYPVLNTDDTGFRAKYPLNSSLAPRGCRVRRNLLRGDPAVCPGAAADDCRWACLWEGAGLRCRSVVGLRGSPVGSARGLHPVLLPWSVSNGGIGALVGTTAVTHGGGVILPVLKHANDE